MALQPVRRDLPERVAAVARIEVLEALLVGEVVHLRQVHRLHRAEVVLGVLLLARLRQRRDEFVVLLVGEVLGHEVEVHEHARALLHRLFLLELLLPLLERAILLELVELLLRLGVGHVLCGRTLRRLGDQ